MTKVTSLRTPKTYEIDHFRRLADCGKITKDCLDEIVSLAKEALEAN